MLRKITLKNNRLKKKIPKWKTSIVINKNYNYTPFASFPHDKSLDYVEHDKINRLGQTYLLERINFIGLNLFAYVDWSCVCFCCCIIIATSSNKNALTKYILFKKISWLIYGIIMVCSVFEWVHRLGTIVYACVCVCVYICMTEYSTRISFVLLFNISVPVYQ